LARRLRSCLRARERNGILLVQNPVQSPRVGGFRFFFRWRNRLCELFERQICIEIVRLDAALEFLLHETLVECSKLHKAFLASFDRTPYDLVSIRRLTPAEIHNDLKRVFIKRVARYVR